MRVTRPTSRTAFSSLSTPISRDLEKRRYVSPFGRIYTYLGLGDKDKAFEWLEKAYAERSDSLAWFRFDPESKILRSDPRFAALMRKVGFGIRANK